MQKHFPKILILSILFFYYNCALTNRGYNVEIEDNTIDIDATTTAQPKQSVQFTQNGKASYMADELHGEKTASGEQFDMRALTAAHKHLPFGTIVRITNPANNRSVKVRINDRGPFVKDRIIDVSFEAAKRLDFVKEGVIEVRIEVIKPGQ